MRKARSATNSLGGCQARTVGTGRAADNKKGHKCIDNRFPEGVPLPFEDRASSRPDSPGPRPPAATVTSAPRSLPRGALHVGCRLQHPLRPRGAPESRLAPPFPRGPWRVPGLIEPRRPSHRRRRTAWRPPSGGSPLADGQPLARYVCRGGGTRTVTDGRRHDGGRRGGRRSGKHGRAPPDAR